MNKVAILSDSTCDLSKELLEQYNIDAIPLHVSFDEESYKDGVDITLEELYNKAEKLGKLPKTSAPSQGEMTAFFKKYLDEGYKIFNFGSIKNMDKNNGNYLFKMGFGGEVYETIGSYDLVINKWLYGIVKLISKIKK